LLRFGQNQNLASPKTFDLLRLRLFPKLNDTDQIAESIMHIYGD